MPERRILDYLAICATGASALVGAWLLLVAMTVLPARDPGMAGPWTAVAVGWLGYAALTARELITTRRSSALHRPVVGASVIAISFGTWLLVGMLARRDDFEGYVVLIGAILVAHGVVVLLRDRTTRRRGVVTPR